MWNAESSLWPKMEYSLLSSCNLRWRTRQHQYLLSDAGCTKYATFFFLYLEKIYILVNMLFVYTSSQEKCREIEKRGVHANYRKNAHLATIMKQGKKQWSERKSTMQAVSFLFFLFLVGIISFSTLNSVHNQFRLQNASRRKISHEPCPFSLYVMNIIMIPCISQVDFDAYIKASYSRLCLLACKKLL